MVKRDVKTSVSEDDEDACEGVVNENGKRPSEVQNVDGKKRLRTKSLYRQPTVRELNRLQETENLFNSNLFRLQVEEILQEVQIKEKTEKKFQLWFTELKHHLLSIPKDDTEYDLSEKTLFKKLKVKLPVSKELEKSKCIFKFHKFTNIDIVGSYALGCSINSKLCIDLQITVPSETYTKNDSVNYKYHKKRAAYLGFIASHLKKLESIKNLTYSWLNGCETKPVLDFKPAGKLGNHVSLRINLVCEQDAYKLHRFSPSRNNLREAWLLSMETSENTSEIGPPTPYYNCSILSDLTAVENQAFLKEVLEKKDNLKQAVVLLKIWLHQRHLQVSGHIVSLIVAYFVQTKRINNIMSSYQIVRNIWIALQTSEWDTKGISLHKGDNTPPMEEFLQHFPIVFLDKTGYYNICGQMCKGTYNALKRESMLAIEMLDNGKINSFIPLFMTPVMPLAQFDHILRFKNLSNLKECVLAKTPKESKINYGLDQLSLVTETIYTLLAKGLGNRVDQILQVVEADFSWPVKKTPEKAKEGYEEKLYFGFLLNPENCINIVEKGPPANLPEAEQFREFWGDKSELRRFQDGTITEACVWEGDSECERRGIIKQILDYLMQLKFDIPQSELFNIGDQLDVVASSKLQGRDSSAGCLDVLRAFDELRRDLRQLTGLPLDVSALYGTSPCFSYTSPLPPAGLPPAPRSPRRRADACLIKDIPRPEGYDLPDYVPVSHAVLELGHSGKWPGDLQAFRCLKAAFNLQIAERLKTQYSLVTQPYPTHIDVLKNGFVFRLRIAHPKEITLLRRETEAGVVKYKESDESVQLQYDTVLLPRLRGALHGLHQKHPSFGPTSCLLQRWLSCHLLAPPHFPASVAELVCAAVYSRAPPPPAAPAAGLLRALRLLRDTHWPSEAIVLDFNDDMTREEISEVERKLLESESPCLRIATAYDGNLPSVWSSQGPSAQVLARVQTLAASTLAYMEDKLMGEGKDNILGAFVPSLSGYDALIHLEPDAVPHAAERLDRRPDPRPVPDTFASDVIPVVEFHPVLRYLDELRSAYDDFALFFHDLYGGDVIAVLWKPDIAEVKDFQITNANALQPVNIKGETKYKINTQALIEDFKLLGRGLVRNITVNT